MGFRDATNIDRYFDMRAACGYCASERAAGWTHCGHCGAVLPAQGDEPSSLEELTPGHTLGSYRIEKEIGRGGMGVVYRALDQSLDRSVALKIVSERFSRLAGFEQQFLAEARAAAAVDHANILPIFAFGETDQVVYLASRYVRGGDLQSRLREGCSLEPRQTLRIIQQVAAALDAVHADGLLHLDVKPSNILVEPGVGQGPHAYLADFGLSFLATRDHRKERELLMGTADYMAPEYIQGKDFDGLSDIYALACVAFRCLAGQSPFIGQSPEQTLELQIKQPVPLMGSRISLPMLDQVFATALARNPKYRFQSGRAFAEALGAAIG